MTRDLLNSKHIVPGNVYLVEAELEKDGGAVSHRYALQLFTELVQQHERGLAITTKPLDAEKFGDTERYWLAAPSIARGDCEIPANSLERIIGTINNASDGTPIILEGLEMLEVYNGFGSVLTVMTILNGIAARKNCAILVPVNPASFSEINYNRLKSQATPTRENIGVK